MQDVPSSIPNTTKTKHNHKRGLGDIRPQLLLSCPESALQEGPESRSHYGSLRSRNNRSAWTGNGATLPWDPTCQLPQPHIHILSWAFAATLSMCDDLGGRQSRVFWNSAPFGRQSQPWPSTNMTFKGQDVPTATASSPCDKPYSSGIRKGGSRPAGQQHVLPARYIYEHTHTHTHMTSLMDITSSHSDTPTPAPQIPTAPPVKCSESDLRREREAGVCRPDDHRGPVLPQL